jgi:hypothetical protein
MDCGKRCSQLCHQQAESAYRAFAVRATQFPSRSPAQHSSFPPRAPALGFAIVRLQLRRPATSGRHGRSGSFLSRCPSGHRGCPVLDRSDLANAYALFRALYRVGLSALADGDRGISHTIPRWKAHFAATWSARLWRHGAMQPSRRDRSHT